jgi:hypothetical protein
VELSLSAAERTAMLDRYLQYLGDGHDVIDRSDPYTIEMRARRPAPKRPNQILHVLLTLSTGWWVIVWAVVARDYGRSLRSYEYDPYLPGVWRVHASEAGEIECFQVDQILDA